MRYSKLAATVSSTAVRALSYFFLRWVPGHPFPPIIFSLAAVYLVSYFVEFFSTSPYAVIADEIELLARPIPAREAVALGVPIGSEEVDIVETIVAQEKPPHVLTTLLTGLPSPSSLFASLATLATTLACVGMVGDLVYRGHIFYPEHDLKFARLGYVDETSARVLVREPDFKHLPIYASVRYADAPVSIGSGHRALDNAWRAAGSVNHLSDDTDFTTTFTFKNLLPDTRYQYALSNNITGYLITAPPVGQVSQRREAHKSFGFMHSSCIMPRFPYDPRDHPLVVPGFKHLTKWIGALRPAFMMFLGDFIYIDNPRRHGSDVESYRRAYRQVYGGPDWPGVASTAHSSTYGPDYDIPWIHTYDDHEIANDWDGNTTGLYPAAFDPYLNYHISVNPPLFLGSSVTPADLALDKSLPTWSTFIQGPASFFILDTRRYRSSNAHEPNDPNASMLGTGQLVSLLTWLSAPTPPGVAWKVVFSSVPFTKNWRVGSSDTWANYLPERQRILEAMWTATTVSGVGIIVLSGDRHEFAATAFPPPPEDDRWTPAATVHEFSASPLNMFYMPVQSYMQSDLEDVCIKYIRDGNSKFGYVEIAAPTGSGQSLLTYRLFIDGEEAWSHVLVAAGGIDGAMRTGRGAHLQQPNAIQWVMDSGKWVQHEVEAAEHFVADEAHAARDGVRHGLRAGERYVEDSARTVKHGVQAGEHFVADSAQQAAHKAHLAEQAAVGGLFAGWNWFGRKAKAVEHEVESDAARAARYAKDNVHKAEDFAAHQTDYAKDAAHHGADRVRDAAGNLKDTVIDDVHHASYRADHAAHAAASKIAHASASAKNSIHRGADVVRDAAGNIIDTAQDNLHHASYRVDHAAHAAASGVKDGVHEAADFASRQKHAAGYTVSSVSSRASAGLKAGEQYVASKGHEAVDAARKGEQKVESGAKAAVTVVSSRVVQGEQKLERGAKAGASAVKKGEQYVVDEAYAAANQARKGGEYVVDEARAAGHAAKLAEERAVASAKAAGSAATQAGKHIGADAVHAGSHAAQDIKKAGQHVTHDAKDFGQHVKDDVKYAGNVPPHHQHGEVEEARTKARNVEDFMREKGSVVREKGQLVSSTVREIGKDGWTKEDYEEAAAGAVAGAAAMGGIA